MCMHMFLFYNLSTSFSSWIRNFLRTSNCIISIIRFSGAAYQYLNHRFLNVYAIHDFLQQTKFALTYRKILNNTTQYRNISASLRPMLLRLVYTLLRIISKSD